MLKGILIVADIIVCFAVIILAMMQSKEDAGASSTITGTSSNKFKEKNKGRTKEGKLKRLTIVFGVLFVIITIALSIVYKM